MLFFSNYIMAIAQPSNFIGLVHHLIKTNSIDNDNLDLRAAVHLIPSGEGSLGRGIHSHWGDNHKVLNNIKKTVIKLPVEVKVA